MSSAQDGPTRLTGTTGNQTSTDAAVTSHMTGTSTLRPGDGAGTVRHKTSAVAVFALVFGLAALFCALTGILSPAAVVFGLIGLVLGVVGLKTSRRVGVTGHGVAVGGLVTALLGLLLGGAVLAGLAAVVNNDGALNRISDAVDKARAELPSGDQLRSQVPGQ